jgi:MFS family permease
MWTNQSSSDEVNYTNKSVWVTRFLKKSEQYLVGGAIISASVLAIVPTILSMVFFVMTAQYLTSLALISHLLLLIVIIIIPMMIRYYDDKVFPSFFEEAKTIIVDKDKFEKMIVKYEEFFQKKFWLTMVPWGVLIVSTIFFNFSYFQKLGASGYFDPIFIIYILFAIWFGIFSGILLHIGLTTVLCIHAVGTLELEIDPLHPDGLGGLSNIGYFAIRATMMISVAALCIPFAFVLARQGGSESFVFAVVGIFIIFLLVLFLYPTLYINRQAQEIRESELEKRREKIQDIQDNVVRIPNAISGEQADIEKELKVQSLREEFKDYENVRLYPLTISIIVRLISSVLLPIIFLILEAYVFPG